MWFKHSTTLPVTTPDVIFARCYNTTPAAATGCIGAAMTTTGTIGVTMDFDATWTLGAATGNTVYHVSTQLYNDNQWHHLLITRVTAAAAVTTFIDGKGIGSTNAVNTTLDGSQILGIGTDCSAGPPVARGELLGWSHRRLYLECQCFGCERSVDADPGPSYV